MRLLPLDFYMAHFFRYSLNFFTAITNQDIAIKNIISNLTIISKIIKPRSHRIDKISVFNFFTVIFNRFFEFYKQADKRLLNADTLFSPYYRYKHSLARFDFYRDGSVNDVFHDFFAVSTVHENVRAA